jgi:arginine-tRNA-protein transferase
LLIDRRKENISDHGHPPKQKHQPDFDVVSTIRSSEFPILQKTPRPKSLEPAHAFTVELSSNSYTDEKYRLYLKYQVLSHKESRHENTPDQFTRFLCSSPIDAKSWSDEATLQTRQTGSFHQLYRLDGELVAFAVLDLLPHTVSSVYFVYDPEKVGRFGMGKVSAVREVAMCIEGGYKYYGLGRNPCLLICWRDMV